MDSLLDVSVHRPVAFPRIVRFAVDVPLLVEELPTVHIEVVDDVKVTGSPELALAEIGKV